MLFRSSKDTNKNLCDADLQEKVHMECNIDRELRMAEPQEQPEENRREWIVEERPTMAIAQAEAVIREMEELPEVAINQTMRG